MLMDSSFFLTTTIVAAAIAFFTLFKKSKLHEENKGVDSSSPSPPSSSLSRKWTHDVFPSFRGEDIRVRFLSHIQKEFKRKGIKSFIDNNIKRGESIGPELINAISSAKIAVVLISKKYASSKWCLDELVEIMKCKKELGLTVLVVFYKVDPSHVKKLTGNFGEVFKKTCAGKTKEDIKRWIQAFAEVATIAGYDSRNWDNEAFMIEEIVAEISKRLIVSAPSKYFEGLVGMEAHMEKMKSLLCLDSNEARLIGIWGPAGIGKTTIARVLFEQYSSFFQLHAFIYIKPSYERPTCSDDYNEMLQFEKRLLSELTNGKEITIPHLGSTRNFLTDKKVLIVLDGVNQLIQLRGILEGQQCLGPGTRIIITTQDQRLLNAFEVKHTYNVWFPPPKEALQIFCINAFGQKSPKDGFEKLAEEVTILAGSLPLGLKVIGSLLKGRSKLEWEGELPRLRARLNGDIQSILKLSYEALDSEDKELFLYIACFFAEERIDEAFEHALQHRFSSVRQGLTVLSQRSLVYDEAEYFPMHSLLVQLGREVVRNQPILERKFLFDNQEIIEVLTQNKGSKSVIIGINFETYDDNVNISESAFEELSNLELLRVLDYGDGLLLEGGLKCLPPKLRILEWDIFPMTSLPSNFDTKFLVKIQMRSSHLEKLWEGIQPLKNLIFMNLSDSVNLKELPDLSMATNLLQLKLAECGSLVEINTVGNSTNLRKLDLEGCSGLVELPSSIGSLPNLQDLYLKKCSSLVEIPASIGSNINLKKLNLRECSSLVELPGSIGSNINLKKLDLRECSSLVELPSSIGNVINLQELYLGGCSSLVEIPSSIGNLTNLEVLDLRECPSLVEIPSTIGNLRKLWKLDLRGCSKLEVLPININLDSLEELDVTDCSRLISFPEISTSIEQLYLRGTSIKEFPMSIKSWSQLQELRIPYLKNIGEFPHALDIITELEFNDTEMVEIPPLFNEISHLRQLVLKNCTKLVSLPPLPGTLSSLHAENCKSLEKVDCGSLLGSRNRLTFINCWKLNEKARDTIIEASIGYGRVILPGREVPAYFTNRAINGGGSVTIKLNNKRCLPTSLRFKVCIMLVNKSDNEVLSDEEGMRVFSTIVDKHSGLEMVSRGSIDRRLYQLLTNHLYIYEVEALDVKSRDLVFEFKADRDEWKIAEIGVRELSEMDSC